MSARSATRSGGQRNMAVVGPVGGRRPESHLFSCAHAARHDAGKPGECRHPVHKPRSAITVFGAQRRGRVRELVGREAMLGAIDEVAPEVRLLNVLCQHHVQLFVELLRRHGETLPAVHGGQHEPLAEQDLDSIGLAVDHVNVGGRVLAHGFDEVVLEQELPIVASLLRRIVQGRVVAHAPCLEEKVLGRLLVAWRPQDACEGVSEGNDVRAPVGKLVDDPVGPVLQAQRPGGATTKH
mmetsp:Transcript_106868/g.299241  ORF Transcript_106868/g.299241 Transcript_106868/m.299241 type:complete len:238 (-) Transcript_106868:774-1487(-)